MNIPVTLIAIVIAYLLGSLPTAVWAGKIFHGIDVREHGSGNIGFANVLRTAGPLWGVLALFLDAGKAFIAAFFLSRLYDQQMLFRLLFGLTVIAGNVLNPFFGFKGGKGVGTGLGVAAAMSPFALLVALLSFGGTLALSRYVSLSSLVASTVFICADALRYRYGRGNMYSLFFASALFAVVVVRHISNIKRLLKGEENKIGK